MAVSAIGTALKVVGVALSAKSAYEGLKEGNLLQAIVGGVGAYYGISSLSAGATASEAAATTLAEGAKQGAETAGAQAAEKIAAETAGAITSAGGVASAGGAAIAGSAASQGIVSGATQILGTEATKQALSQGAQEVAKKGLISTVGTYLNDNPAVTQAGLGLIGGYMEGEAEQEMLDQQQELMAQRRRRMGTPGDVSSVVSIQWNPETGRFENRSRQ